MTVEFHNGPLEGEARDIPEPLSPIVQVPIFEPLMFVDPANPLPSLAYQVALYDLVYDIDGPYYVFKEPI